MNCPLCGRKIFIDTIEENITRLIGPYVISQPPNDDKIEVCGQCYLLVNILEVLKDIRNSKVTYSVQSMDFAKEIKDGKS